MNGGAHTEALRHGGAPLCVSVPLGEIAVDALRGGIAGAVGWWVMDQALQRMYDREERSVRAAEDRARGGVPALERVAEAGGSTAGAELTLRQRQRAGTALQWTVGIGAGMLYGVLRSRVGAARAGRGLAFGAAFSLVVDEGAVPLLGFAPGPRAFPWQTHARGFVGHLVFGLATEATLAVLDNSGAHTEAQRHGEVPLRASV